MVKKLIITACLSIVGLYAFSQSENLYSKFSNGDIISSAAGTSREQLKLCSTESINEVIGVFYKTENELQLERHNQDLVINAVKAKGHVDVKYNEENGSIRKGDLITGSSTPGEGMKATDSGMVLGIALEDPNSKTGMVKIRLLIQYVK